MTHVLTDSAEIAAELQGWDVWCKCKTPGPDIIIPRGHSVDVECGTCCGLIQIG